MPKFQKISIPMLGKEIYPFVTPEEVDLLRAELVAAGMPSVWIRFGCHPGDVFDDDSRPFRRTDGQEVWYTHGYHIYFDNGEEVDLAVVCDRRKFLRAAPKRMTTCGGWSKAKEMAEMIDSQLEKAAEKINAGQWIWAEVAWRPVHQNGDIAKPNVQAPRGYPYELQLSYYDSGATSYEDKKVEVLWTGPIPYQSWNGLHPRQSVGKCPKFKTNFVNAGVVAMAQWYDDKESRDLD